MKRPVLFYNKLQLFWLNILYNLVLNHNWMSSLKNILIKPRPLLFRQSPFDSKLCTMVGQHIISHDV